MEAVDLLVLHQGNGLNAPGHHGRYLLGHNPLGRQGNGLQTRAAEPVDRKSGGGYRKARADGRQTGNIPALGALLEGRTHDNIFNNGRINTGPLDGMLDHVPRQIDTVGVIQRAPVGLTQAGACGGNDDCIRHNNALNFRKM